jgi:hypothetical protein
MCKKVFTHETCPITNPNSFGSINSHSTNELLLQESTTLLILKRQTLRLLMINSFLVLLMPRYLGFMLECLCFQYPCGVSHFTFYYLRRGGCLPALVSFSLSLLPPLRTFLGHGDSIPNGLYSLIGVRPKRCRDRVCGVTGECGDSFFRR